jgi:hypothetical protein
VSALPPDRLVAADLEKIKTVAIHSREHLVSREAFGRPVEPDATIGAFLDSLPRTLAAEELRELAEAIARARAESKKVLFGLGGHVIKVGLGPLLADMIERGAITDLALNGSAGIHDLEIALLGKTSEKVAETITDGRFGMVKETAEAFARVFRSGAKVGLGRALAEEIDQGAYRFREDSLVWRAVRAGASVTIHVAIGTDTVHAVPGASGEAIGQATHLDFRRLATVVSQLSHGVYVNVGSAVVMPEVFLKSVSVARNLGDALEGVTAANLDMVQHYRPRVNILERPVKRGIQLTGHHELLIPLLRIETLRRLAAHGGPDAAGL